MSLEELLMNSLKFYLVDVFAEKKFGGNQLAVVTDAAKLTKEEMQKIAFEFNFSEITFIISENNNKYEYDVRIFTPKSEIPFAGHPTLGTSFVIQKEIIKKEVNKIFLKLKAGTIPVEIIYKENIANDFWMKQNIPCFGEIYSSDIISEILNINREDLDDNFPIQVVSTGLPGLIVPLKNLNAIKRCKINKKLYFDFIKNKEFKAIFVFTSETYMKGNDINARMFADFYGIPEDPATGSINGCLAGYLIKHLYFKKDNINLKVEQGYEIDRQSLLYIKAYLANNKINIHVGGKVIKIGEGNLIL
jgi:trans-2,3-dihydro-3-hydroxyanthranilate isomerase